MLYMGIGGSTLLFLVIFFVFLKKEFVNQNIPYSLPSSLWLSTFTIIFSSFTLWLCSRYFELQQFKLMRTLMLITLFLGFLFMYLQFMAWRNMINQNMSLANNTGASFVYIFTGLHLVHLLAGVVGLFITSVKVMRKTEYVDAFIYSQNPPNKLNLRLISIYWHFLDILWLIIFGFLVYHAS